MVVPPSDLFWDKHHFRGQIMFAEVGKTYKIPCAKVSDWRYFPFGDNYCYLPVLLPAHVDANDDCLRSLETHYHYDFRFIKPESIPSKWKGGGIFKKDVLEIVEQNKVAVSSNTWIVENLANNSFFFWNLWHQNKADSKIIDNKCPHKGVELVNKCGTCPAHGLQWDFQTGRLAEYKLPFYLEITNYEIPDPTNNRGIIENNTCKVVIQNKYPLTKNIKAIMVDSLGKRYGKMYHKLNNAIKFYNPGDIINFDTSQICV